MSYSQDISRKDAWDAAVAALCAIDWSATALTDEERLVCMGRRNELSDTHWTALIANYGS